MASVLGKHEYTGTLELEREPIDESYDQYFAVSTKPRVVWSLDHLPEQKLGAIKLKPTGDSFKTCKKR